MSLTVSLTVPRAERLTNNLGIVTGTITFDSSYPTGGEDASDISRYFKSLKVVTFNNKGGYVFEYDSTNDKIKVLYPTKSQTSNLAGSVTVTNAVGDGDSGTYNVSFTGTKGTVDAGVAEEVANATDLSSLTVEFVAIGMI